MFQLQGGAGVTPGACRAAILVLAFMGALLACAGIVRADPAGLPDPVTVDHITIEPHDGKVKDFYTAESLLRALPHLRRTEIGRTLAFGKVWLFQKGVIHLKSGAVIPWRAFADNLVLFDTAEGPVVYTDITGQTRSHVDGRVVTTLYTREGQGKVMIEYR